MKPPTNETAVVQIQTTSSYLQNIFFDARLKKELIQIHQTFT